jgi:hypothetical protein
VSHLAVDHNPPLCVWFEHVSLDDDGSMSVVIGSGGRAFSSSVNYTQVCFSVRTSLLHSEWVVAVEHASHEVGLGGAPVDFELQLHTVIMVKSHELTSFKVAYRLRVFVLFLRKY